MLTKLFLLPAVVVGFGLGVAFPGRVDSAPTGKTLSAFMTPPSLSDGSSSPLTCGWHSVCSGNPPPAGTGLDWDDSNTDTRWFFRGFFAVNTGPSYVIATGHPLISSAGSTVCDTMTVWIIETYSGKLRAAPKYLHVDLSLSAAVFNITGGSFYGQYMSRSIGRTINDTGCTFFGTHVHEDDAPISGTTTTRNTGRYPSGASCSTSCGVFPNNIANNYTRKFVWAEGS